MEAAGSWNAMQIRRHSKIAVTIEIYTGVPSGTPRDAVKKLGQWLDGYAVAVLPRCTGSKKGRFLSRNRPLTWWAILGSNQ